MVNMDKNDVNTTILAAKSPSPPMIFTMVNPAVAVGVAKIASRETRFTPVNPAITASDTITAGIIISLTKITEVNSLRCP